MPPPAPPLAGGEAAPTAGDAVEALLRLVRDVVRISGAGFGGPFRKDCTDLSRRIGLLSYLFEEIRDSKGRLGPLDASASASSSSSSSCLSDLTVALQAAKRLLLASVDPTKISSVSTVLVT